MQDIIEKKSVVKCDFDIGKEIDVEEFIQEKLSVYTDLGRWQKDWSIRERDHIRPRRSLRSWDVLLCENSSHGWII